VGGTIYPSIFNSELLVIKPIK